MFPGCLIAKAGPFVLPPSIAVSLSDLLQKVDGDAQKATESHVAQGKESNTCSTMFKTLMTDPLHLVVH